MYKWRVINIDPETMASYPLLQEIIQYGYQMQHMIVAGWHQLPSVIIHSILFGFIAELKILTNSCDKIIENADIAVEKERSQSESVDTDVLFWKHYKMELNTRVKSHAAILTNLINLRQILKPVLLMSYYLLLMVNAFIICSVQNGYFSTYGPCGILMIFYMNVDFGIVCYNMSKVDDLVTALTKCFEN